MSDFSLLFSGILFFLECHGSGLVIAPLFAIGIIPGVFIGGFIAAHSESSFHIIVGVAIFSEGDPQGASILRPFGVVVSYIRSKFDIAVFLERDCRPITSSFTSPVVSSTSESTVHDDPLREDVLGSSSSSSLLHPEMPIAIIANKAMATIFWKWKSLCFIVKQFLFALQSR